MVPIVIVVALATRDSIGAWQLEPVLDIFLNLD